MLDRLCTQTMLTNLGSMHKDAYKAMHREENLSSSDGYSVRTRRQSSINHVESKNNLSN